MFPLGTKLLVVFVGTQTPDGVLFDFRDQVHEDLSRGQLGVPGEFLNGAHPAARAGCKRCGAGCEDRRSRERGAEAKITGQRIEASGGPML